MKCGLLLLILFWSGSSVSEQQTLHQWNTESFVLERPKRQADDTWSWGYVNTADSANTQDERNVEVPETTTEENPCLRTLPSRPDFRAPGRRVSETKCFEYIWQIKSRQIGEKNSDDCTTYTIKHKSGGVLFAIGGRPAIQGEFPHMAGIGWPAVVGSWLFKCGGSLISAKFVLTAAHCTKASPRDTTIADVVPKIVRMGDKNIIDVWSNGLFPRDANISRIIVHPQYVSPKKYFDIALLELEKVMQFDKNLQPACLWSNFDTSSLGKEATVTGWGVIETAGRTTSPNLQAAVVDLIDSQQCDALLRPMCNRLWCGIEETQICAGKLAGGVDACQGDSGGPLQVKIPLPPSAQGAIHYVIGITSFGFQCARPNTPGVYTRVSTFIDWIENIVWG